jgi:origin recognition complex subunit 5
VLDARQIPSATVKCIDCLSLRHLLSRIFVACVKATGQLDALEQHDRVDSLNSLVLGLQKLLQNYGQKVVLVLDGIDRQRGASPTLLPAIARLGETVHKSSCLRYFAIY